MDRLLVVFLAALCSRGVAVFYAESATPAVPDQPIPAIVKAFQTHRVVALGEGEHNNEQGHAFRLALIRDSRFQAIVNDVVVEWGNARYQGVMDRFVRGEGIPDAELRHVWQDTTQALPIWDVPIYEEFFRAVRDVNHALPPARQLRVLLGDPPIDWSKVRNTQEFIQWQTDKRTSFPAGLIAREVLAKGHRALVIYGDMHLQRRNVLTNYDMANAAGATIVSLLEHTGHERAFTIWTNTNADLTRIQPDLASWPRPSMTNLSGTSLGRADFAAYLPGDMPRASTRRGVSVPVPHEQWRALPMEEQFDALLYLGPPATITHSQMTAALCRDPEYVAMRLTRIALLPSAPGMPNQIDAFKEQCATITSK